MRSGSRRDEITRVSKTIIIAFVLVSFFGLLPRFKPYVLLQPSNILNKFPKVWILFISQFYCETLLGLSINIFVFLYIPKMMERVWGSKEVFRFITLISFYSNIFIFAFAIICYYSYNRDKYILYRSFETSTALISGLFMGLSFIFKEVVLQTSFGPIRPRYYPFISFCVSLTFSLFTTCDSLLCTLVGNTLAYVYCRYLRPLPRNGKRGDDDMRMTMLVPGCSCCTPSQQDEQHDHGFTGFPGTFRPQSNTNRNNNRNANSSNNSSGPFSGRANRL